MWTNVLDQTAAAAVTSVSTLKEVMNASVHPATVSPKISALAKVCTTMHRVF